MTNLDAPGPETRHPRPAWYRDREILRQLPLRMRILGAYCRIVWRHQPASRRTRGHIIGSSFLIRAIGSARRSLGLSNDGEVVIEGLRLFCDLSDTRFVHVVDELRDGTSDRRILARLLTPGACFVDVGANHGSFAIAAAEIVGGTGTIIAIEPQPDLARLVQKSLSAGPAGTSHVFATAVGDTRGQIDLFVPRGRSGLASIHREAVTGRVPERVKVSTTTLDDLLSEAAAITADLVLKIDVEGHELAVLDGATEVISVYQPPIILEINPHTANAAKRPVKRLVDALHDLGYRIVEYSDFPVPVAPDKVNLTQSRNVVAMASHDLRRLR